MLSTEQNDLITRTGPGTPAGKLMRCYWQPAALVDELAGNRPVKPLRLLGENLVLFRDEQGRYGLLERACPHRGTDLAFGRLENGGLRCAFHGWLFDASGQCLETPAEPKGSTLCKGIKLCEQHKDYVSREMLRVQLHDTEEDHTYWLEKQLGLIKLIGLENYLQSHT